MHAADFQIALAANDNSKRLLDVPKFYGNTKDTLTARDFLRDLSKQQLSEIGPTNRNAQSSAICYILKPTGS